MWRRRETQERQTHAFDRGRSRSGEASGCLSNAFAVHIKGQTALSVFFQGRGRPQIP
jgi:hypothetical protein